eukprot:1160985-Pelagomonas_calceolata.AAC.1
MVAIGFDLQPGSLAARSAQLFQPYRSIHEFGNKVKWGVGLQPGGLTAQPAGLCQTHKKHPYYQKRSDTTDSNLASEIERPS